MKPDTNEFVSLVTKYSASLKPFAVSLTRDSDDAQDLLQETVLRALSSQGTYAEGTNLKAWLYTIMKNIFINNYRRNKKRNAIFDNSGNLVYIGLSGAMRNEGESTMEMDEIQSEINKLDECYRSPFVMHFRGFKYHEIASSLHLPVGTVKSRIHSARLELKTALKKIGLCPVMA